MSDFCLPQIPGMLCRMRYFTVLLFFTLLAFALPVHAAESVAKPPREETIRELEIYFNGIRTLQADFLQTLNDGGLRQGKISISRPGKMRIDYANPDKSFMVADGAFVHVYDAEAKSSSSVPLGSSMADIILRDELKLSGDIQVKSLDRPAAAPNMLEVTLVQAEEPDAGTITLEFEEKPQLQLRNWRVVDAQGLSTRVALFHERIGANLPSSLFVFKDPSFGKGKQ